MITLTKTAVSRARYRWRHGGFLPLGRWLRVKAAIIMKSRDWTFSGPFGKFDKAQLQRGLQIYREVCSSCHSLNYIAFRNLGQDGALGYSEDQIKSLAAEYEVEDGPNADGDMFTRAGKPFDHFPSPFPNVEAAAAANGGKAPPDLSLIAKARAASTGPDVGIELFNDILRLIWHPITAYQEYGPGLYLCPSDLL